jgi:F-type H+-transporting ATPase subunit b
MEIVSQSELVSINATMLVQVISFLIFLFVIQRIMFRPLRQTMEERSAHIKQLRQEMKLQEKKLREIAAALRKEEQSLKAEAFLESDQREAAGKQEAKAILRQTREDIRAQQRSAVEDIRQRIDAGRKQLLQDVEPLVAMILEKILGRRVQP